jgi:uncharacterized RDD family membrane protein YckC
MAAAYLATPLRRTAAAAIDFGVVFLLSLLAAAIIQQIRLDLLAIGLGSILIFIAYHFSFLYYWSGETPGRRLLDIRVVSSRATIDLTPLQCVGRPLLRLLWLIAFLPLERSFEIPWLSMAPLFADLALMTFLPSRQTVADLLCRTVVVNTPPPQPHRAPAGPMYSATDAEFGVRPRAAR